MRRGMVLVLLVLVALLGCTPVPTAGQSGGPPIAFVRRGDLWLWEGGEERLLAAESRESAAARNGDIRRPRFSHDGRFIAYQRGRALEVTGLPYGGAVDRAGNTPPVGLEPGWEHSGCADEERNLHHPGRITGAGEARTGGPRRSMGEPRLVAGREADRRLPPGAVGAEPVRGEDRGRRCPVRWRREPRVVLEERYSGSGGGCGSGASPNPRWAVWNPSHPSLLALVDGHYRTASRNKRLRLASPPWASGTGRRLTPAAHADREPAWDPSGRYLAFTRSLEKEPAEVREAAPEQRIQVLDTGRGSTRPIPGSEGGYGPFWGRDGSLFWLMPEGDSADLWALRGGRAAPLIRGLKRHEYYDQWTGQDLLDTP